MTKQRILKASLLTAPFAISILSLIFAIGWAAREFLLPDPILPLPLRAVTPEQAGLVWQECELPLPALASGSPRPDESVACFGHPAPMPVADNHDNAVQFIDKTHLRMTVGQDDYEARANDLTALTAYTLDKNGGRVRSLVGPGDTLWLHMFLLSVNGHVAWGIANENPATILYDGKDLRQVYGLDKAYAAYGLEGKLIFVAQKGGKYFVVYDGQKVGPDYDQITIGYCCETALYTARGGQGRYQFRGTRDGKNHIVEISTFSISSEERNHH